MQPVSIALCMRYLDLDECDQPAKWIDGNEGSVHPKIAYSQLQLYDDDDDSYSIGFQLDFNGKLPSHVAMIRRK